MTRASLFAFLLVTASLVSLSNSQPAPANPPVPVTAQCYYHGIVGSLVNQCTNQLRIPNCGAVAVPGFSYEACDCNRTIENGIDVILVLDQLPYTGNPAASSGLWDGFVAILGPALGRLLDTASNDNYVGVIRPTANGCDNFGFPDILRPAADFAANARTTYPYNDPGQCALNPFGSAFNCNRTQVKHLDCVDLARTTLLADGPAPRTAMGRRKNIISIRHSPGFPRTANGGADFANEPANGLGYLFITTSNFPDTSDNDIPNVFPTPTTDYEQSEYDYGGFVKTGNDLIVLSSLASVARAILASPTPGFIQCNDPSVVNLINSQIIPEAPPIIADMICTYWPRAPRLTWVPLQVAGQGVIRGSVPVITSWLCQLTPPTSAPTATPTRTPTNSPSESPTRSPTRSPTESPTESPTQSPTQSPSQSPTKSPTVCEGPPPDNKRNDCSSDNCNGDVVVNPNPVVTPNGDGTTTLCYSYTLNNVNSPCAGSGAVDSIAFSMDECCPDGAMDFVDAVSVGSTSFSRAMCPQVGPNDQPPALAPGCNRATRTCTAALSAGEQCTVVNVNGVNIAGDNQYCITVVGTNFDNGAGGLSSPVEKAKMCFARMPGPDFTCSCAEVEFIPSPQICEKTDNPTAAPSNPPTPGGCVAIPPADPPVPGCDKNCGDIAKTEFTGRLVSRTVKDGYTEFEYCVDVDESEEPECKSPVGKRQGSSSSGGCGKSSDSSNGGNGGRKNGGGKSSSNGGGNGRGNGGGNGNGRNGRGGGNGGKSSSNGGNGGNGGNKGGNGRRNGGGNRGGNGGKKANGGGNGANGGGNGGNGGGNGGNGNNAGAWRWRQGGRGNGNKGKSDDRRRLGQSWRSGRGNGRGGGKGSDSGSSNGGGNGKSSSSGKKNPPPTVFFSPNGLTLRLDECCPVCLTKYHFADYEDGNYYLKINNPEVSYYSYYKKSVSPQSAGSASFTLAPGKKVSATRKCYKFALFGDIGVEKGKYCVRGADPYDKCSKTKCGCGNMMVPSSCDIKAYKDPVCKKKPVFPKKKFFGKSSSGNGRSNGRGKGGKSSSGGNGKGFGGLAKKFKNYYKKSYYKKSGGGGSD